MGHYRYDPDEEKINKNLARVAVALAVVFVLSVFLVLAVG
jgi:hypothetical protein